MNKGLCTHNLGMAAVIPTSIYYDYPRHGSGAARKSVRRIAHDLMLHNVQKRLPLLKGLEN